MVAEPDPSRTGDDAPCSTASMATMASVVDLDAQCNAEGDEWLLTMGKHNEESIRGREGRALEEATRAEDEGCCNAGEVAGKARRVLLGAAGIEESKEKADFSKGSNVKTKGKSIRDINAADLGHMNQAQIQREHQ